MDWRRAGAEAEPLCGDEVRDDPGFDPERDEAPVLVAAPERPRDRP
jgi:hypothetical protein